MDSKHITSGEFLRPYAPVFRKMRELEVIFMLDEVIAKFIPRKPPSNHICRLFLEQQRDSNE